MIGRFERLPREEECNRILRGHNADFACISDALDKQFRTIHNRAQLLLGICGVLISASVVVTTGRIIGRPDFLHQHFAGRLLIVAGVLDIASAAVVVANVLSVRWITQQPGADLRAWVLSNLEDRDRKTRAYRIGIFLVLLSMVSYQTAVAMALIQLLKLTCARASPATTAARPSRRAARNRPRSSARDVAPAASLSPPARRARRRAGRWRRRESLARRAAPAAARETAYGGTGTSRAR